MCYLLWNYCHWNFNNNIVAIVIFAVITNVEGTLTVSLSAVTGANVNTPPAYVTVK